MTKVETRKEISGVLLFNKPILWTSHDAVDFFRRRLHQKSVGHAGTLDPLATGLLVILLGRATKLSAEFTKCDKDYSGTMMLGLTTDTQDLEGKILSLMDYEGVLESEVASTFSGFRGKQQQTPPIFSAVRQKGKKSYDLARKGIAVRPEPREILISQFSLTAFDSPEVHFSLTCSKGTYVRALCQDVGQKLGVGAVLSSLVRTRVGNFFLKSSISEGEARAMSAEDLEKRLAPHDRL